MPRLEISCLCGAATQNINATAPLGVAAGYNDSGSISTGLSMCHCDTCRHQTGLLCASYYPIGPDARPALHGLTSHESPAGRGAVARFFCSTCGCHVFRARRERDGDSPGALVGWEAATGAIVNEEPAESEHGDAAAASAPRYTRHVNVADTRDGGLSVWLRRVDGLTLEMVDEEDDHACARAPAPGARGSGAAGDTKKYDGQEGEDVLPAHCLCGNVRFHITRPDGDVSRRPRSQFPDLMVPYREGGAEVKNPADAKWWLRPPLPLTGQQGQPESVSSSSSSSSSKGRYLAGTCACRSCRLASGFEIQTWAFVPRANIIFHVAAAAPHDGSRPQHQQPPATGTMPLDFEALPRGVLTSYASSEGVRREFCGVCGASVFWHDAWRPELIDVSAGLLAAPLASAPGGGGGDGGGARAEAWLDWWRARVSFAEDAALGRAGEAGRRACRLIAALGEGLGS